MMKGASRGGAAGPGGVMEFEVTERDWLSSSSGCGGGVTSCSSGDAVPDLNESATALRLGPPKAEEKGEEVRPAAAAAATRNSAILEEFRQAKAMKAQQQVPVVPMPYQATTTTPLPFFSKSYGVKRGFSEVDVKVAQTWMPSPFPSRKPAPAAAAAIAPVDPPAAVGWPPVRSFVRNNASNVKPTTAVAVTDAQEKQEEVMAPLSSSGAKSLFVKIYMDGVPFGRKVDLLTNNRYEKLYSALEEMFHHFLNVGHYSGSQTSTSSTKSHFVPSSSSRSSSRKLNFLDGSEYVLIYEDHEGDSMLVGDVPWELFVNTVKRLRIMKGSEEVNLAPKNTDPAVKTQAAI